MGISEASFTVSDNILGMKTIEEVVRSRRVDLFFYSEDPDIVAGVFHDYEIFVSPDEYNLTKLGQYYVAWDYAGY